MNDHQIKSVLKKAFIIIPTYNEKDNITLLIRQLENVFHFSGWNFQILVVDDHSPDQTAEVVKDLQSQFPNLHLLTGEKKGLGDAYRRGFQYVLDNGQADYIFQMDADLQHDPKDIVHFLAKADAGSEFIIGSRYLEKNQNKQWRGLRKVFSLSANILARYLAGIKHIQDCTSGYRCIAVPFLHSFDMKVLDSNGYAFQISLLHVAQKKKISIVEIPISFTFRQRGTSKLGLGDIGEFFWNALRLRFKRY